MDKSYQPEHIEPHWSQFWEEHGYSAPSGDGKPYCIMLPPPNVTGTLHMGHGFQITIMDALIRKHRMQGCNTLWQGGTDHAGIATQMVVERQLEAEQSSRHDLGREKFLERVWSWKQQSGSTITRQIRRLGASIDWTRERFTMDDDISKATREAFIRLYEEGYIYRGQRLVNWDPKLHTAISDLEVSTETEAGSLWYIRYPLVEPISGDMRYVVVATTRPETMLGDTAVAVHPEDTRYQALIGKQVKIPLTERTITIIADESIDPAFGTGCVKITPAHDFNDYETGKRHNLPLINIFTLNAHLNEQVPARYQGLERFVARKQIVKDLEAQDLMEKIEPHQLNIPRGDRSGVIVEPMLSEQWYVRMKDLAKPALDAVESGEIQIVPESWGKTYLQWLQNIEDWNISRQLWWGHRIPVWYDKENKPYVGHDEADVRHRYQLPENLELTQDSDVLDTWFSASLWPFATLGWPTQTRELKTFYPTDVLVTGFDIIFFWVARMVMMGLKFTGKIPFKKVYITGLIRDSQGKKMSKTKGNILDPIDLIDGIELEPLIKKRCVGLMQPQMAKTIEQNTRKEFPKGIAAYGTDALRFTYCALATMSRNINFDLGRTEGYRFFCNKLWNAARYVIMNTENHDLHVQDAELSLPDRWILSELMLTIKRVHEAFEHFRFDLVAQALYEFTWGEYCDWYLELSKCVLNNPKSTPAQLRGTRRTLIIVLETLLRLMHPIMPFITEEIWHKIAPMLDIHADTIMQQPFPEFEVEIIDEVALNEMSWLKNMINCLRNIRSETGIAPSKTISVLLHRGTPLDIERVEHCMPYFRLLTKVEQMQFKKEAEIPQACSTAVLGALEIYVPLAGLIDKNAELNRISKEIDKLAKEKDQAEKKLANANYVEKAPAEVVAKERERLVQTEKVLMKLQSHYQMIAQL